MVHNQVAAVFCHFHHRNMCSSFKKKHICEDHQVVFIVDTQELMPIS